MNQKTVKTNLVVGICLLMASVGQSAPVSVYLRAGTTTLTMTDGRQVVMWGFAKDSGALVQDGTITVPGPALAFGPDAQSLTIHLKNTLPEPVSIVIPGQWATQGDPARNPDGRVRSFTHEAPPGGTADYTWSNLKSGTYLYHSGSHPALQVQMGLYGALTRLTGFGEAYSGVHFDREITLLLGEVDPDLHDAVAINDYGPGKTITSTLKYHPQYFLINGVSYTNGLLPVFAGRPADRILLRFINAGLDYRAPTLNGGYFSLISEDGSLLPFPRETYTTLLSPLKTMDALFTVTGSEAQTFALYDRRLGLVNSTAAGAGGMLTHLNIDNPSALTNLPASWITNYFGSGPSYPPNTVGMTDDPDHDGVSNYAEYIAGTDPSDPYSLLYISNLNPMNQPQGPIVTFEPTFSGRRYNMQFSTNLVSGAWTTVYTNIPGYAGYMYLTDLVNTNSTQGFYRITVELP